MNRFFGAKKSAYIVVEIVKVDPMVQKMVMGKAEEMPEATRVSGRVELDGILS